MFMPGKAQEIWHESFTLPGKGIHGSPSGTILYDCTDITAWELRYNDLELSDEGDYAQTVSTAGGRFEVCDIDGEVAWLSQWITIGGHPIVNVELTAAETGSGNNSENKYMKVYYRLDEDEEVLFAENGSNSGNWGSVTARQEGLSGSRLQIVCYMANHYASDKVILDEVTVWATQEPITPVLPGEVVINELMADPVPEAGLPPVEYIELYNVRNSAVRTEGWQLRIDGVSKSIPAGFIAPGGYMLLCATGSLDELDKFGNVVNVPGFQGLINKGAKVEIIGNDGVLLDEITYSESWYADDLKQDGGWSLERIDPDRHCNQKENWMASQASEGGTPGAVNSVFGENQDDAAPSLVHAVAVSAGEIEIMFSEPVDSMVVCRKDNFLLEGHGNPDTLITAAPGVLILHFNQPLNLNQIYLLNIRSVVDECSNAFAPDATKIQWNVIEPGDVLVSELLFNPYPGCADFVEIYNNSGKIIDLSRLSLSRPVREEEQKEYPLTQSRELLFPGEYLVLTEDTASLFMHYHTKCRNCFLQLPDMPSLPDAEGEVAILNEKHELVDVFAYTEKMHSEFLASCEGISLERISCDEPSGNSDNWHSASEQSGYATPGYKNSQSEPTGIGRPAVTFEPKAFSPNYDGYNDVFRIRYHTSGPGYVANVRVFDVEGRYIHALAENQLLGTEGEITWNGKDTTGGRLPLGIYLIAIEIYNDRGEVYRYKEGVVLTDILY